MGKYKCYEFKVQGMHCPSCELTIERKIKKFKNIKAIDANLDTGTLKVTGKFTDDADTLAQKFSKMLEKEGYSIGRELTSEYKKRNWKEYVWALLIALILGSGYVFLQNSGLLETNIQNLNYGTYFLIGFLASLSSCAALVGGILLSMSANDVKEERSITKEKLNQVIFHVSRLISFFVLGGVLGLLGASFSLASIVSVILSLAISTFIYRELAKKDKISEIYRTLIYIISAIILALINYYFINAISSLVNLPANLISQSILTILIAIVMFVLAMNLLDFFDITYKFQLQLPKGLLRFFLKSENINNFLSPLLLGVVSFFLPCGFTLTAQGLALESRSFFDGAMIMFVFALGTLPVLALISFSSINLGENKKVSGIFFKTSGFLIIAIAAYNVINALKIIGIGL